MIYVENMQFPHEERRVYPFGLLSQKGVEHIEFAPITILYGNNGSGKSTLLNIIAGTFVLDAAINGNKMVLKGTASNGVSFNYVFTKE